MIKIEKGDCVRIIGGFFTGYTGVVDAIFSFHSWPVYEVTIYSYDVSWTHQYKREELELIISMSGNQNKECSCGADFLKHPGHSTWCAKC
jgi:transcription antitermination factor NusG